MELWGVGCGPHPKSGDKHWLWHRFAGEISCLVAVQMIDGKLVCVVALQSHATRDACGAALT